MTELVCAIGEIHTGLIRHSGPLPLARARELISLTPGRSTETIERPIEYARSGRMLTGIDCEIQPAHGGRTRIVGTVAARVSLVGGQLVQASSHLVIVPSRSDHRQPWYHYTALPGRAELIGKADGGAIADAFLTNAAGGPHVNLEAVNARLLDAVQRSPLLDRRMPVRAERGCLRWAVLPGHTGTALVIGWEGRSLRTLRIAHPDPPLDELMSFFADVARHDWLLTSVLGVEERTRQGIEQASAYERARAAIETLLPHWLPNAGGTVVTDDLWTAVERGADLSRRWATITAQLRDRMFLRVMETASGPRPLTVSAPRAPGERVLDP